MPLPPVALSHTDYAGILSLASCWNLAALSICPAGVYSLSMNASQIGADTLAGVVNVLLLSFVLGSHGTGCFVHFLFNQHHILLFILNTGPGIPPFSILIRLPHTHLDLNLQSAQ